VFRVWRWDGLWLETVLSCFKVDYNPVMKIVGNCSQDIWFPAGSNPNTFRQPVKHFTGSKNAFL
jgi:hypothetical protein